jgi:hypothetical protein
MKELIEDYQRRLATITETIKTTSDTGSRNDIAKMARLNAKASEYRTFIAELERSYRNYIKEHMDELVENYNTHTYGGASGGTIRALILLTIELANDMGIEVEVKWEGHTTYTMK